MQLAWDHVLAQAQIQNHNGVPWLVSVSITLSNNFFVNGNDSICLLRSYVRDAARISAEHNDDLGAQAEDMYASLNNTIL